MPTGAAVRYPITIDGETAEIGTAAELGVALDVLQGHRDRQVLEQLRPHLAGILDGPLGLALVLKSLSPEDQVYLIESLGPRLAGTIREARFLRDILATMASIPVEEVLLKTLGREGLRGLIVTAEELSEVLEWVYRQCDVLLLDLLGDDYLPGLFHGGQELSAVLHGMDAAAQERLVERLGWERIAGCLRDGRDLACVLRALPASVSGKLLAHLDRERLVDLIGNARDWRYLCERLEPAEAATVYAKIGVDVCAA